MRVLIIPEDPTLDQHVLKPIVERIFEDLQRPARVEVLRDPHISGVTQALDQQIVAEIIRDNRMIDLFILMVDRDCNRLTNTERAHARQHEHPDHLIACLAWQEVEVWPLALHRATLNVPWPEVRAHCDPKEAHWDPFIQQQGWIETVGRGRKKAMRDLGRSWRGLLQVCPEINDLKTHLQRWLEQRS